MASHGMPRASSKEEPTGQAREKELKEIRVYRELVDSVNAKREFTPELLQRTAELLRRNPEYYTIWNHRRRIYANEFASLKASVDAGELAEDSRCSQVLDIVQLDLQFLFPLLVKFPKCYWIWNHRLWLLEQATSLLPAMTAQRLWEEELGLVGKMLSRDSRNFHGWGYRRRVISSLESPALDGSSMTRSEFDYTTKMIGANLSNFSAWHNRTKLILRILEEESATKEERRKMLDEELQLIHKALFDPYDQSLWFYHQSLMCTFDPILSSQTMAPQLTDGERLEYISTEREFILEILEDAEDCKWIYQALIECSRLESKIEGKLSAAAKKDLSAWLSELKKLDPLRAGRWADLEQSLETKTK